MTYYYRTPSSRFEDYKFDEMIDPQRIFTLSKSDDGSYGLIYGNKGTFAVIKHGENVWYSAAISAPEEMRSSINNKVGRNPFNLAKKLIDSYYFYLDHDQSYDRVVVNQRDNSLNEGEKKTMKRNRTIYENDEQNYDYLLDEINIEIWDNIEDVIVPFIKETIVEVMERNGVFYDDWEDAFDFLFTPLYEKYTSFDRRI